MNKSNSAVPETSKPTLYDREQEALIEYRRLDNEKCKMDNDLAYNRYTNNALKDKLESARRNISELSSVCFQIYEKGLCKNNNLDDPDHLGYASLHKRAIVILKQNIEALSEIDKFTC